MDDTTGRVTGSSTQDETDARTQEIREEIVQTRIEMSETIEAIEDRLRPSHLVAQAGETVRNAATEKVKSMANTAGHVADRAMDTSFAQTVRSNPIPAAMIGIGAAWLLMKGRSDGARHARSRSYARYRAYGNPERDWRVDPGDVSPPAAVGTTGYGDYGGGTSPVRGTSDVPELGGEMYGYRRSHAQPAGFERVVRENPLLVGAAAALVGVAIGMSLPASETENRLMGEARDTVVDRAREAASEAAGKVQDVAGKAVEAATEVRDAASRATGKKTEPGRRTSTPG